MFTKSKLIAASIAIIALGTVMGAQAQQHSPGFVKMMHVDMADGSGLDLEVIKVQDHMMVLVPEDKVYEALHQTLFKKTP